MTNFNWETKLRKRSLQIYCVFLLSSFLTLVKGAIFECLLAEDV